MVVSVVYLGRVPYPAGLELQARLVGLRKAGAIGGVAAPGNFSGGSAGSDAANGAANGGSGGGGGGGGSEQNGGSGGNGGSGWLALIW